MHFPGYGILTLHTFQEPAQGRTFLCSSCLFTQALCKRVDKMPTCKDVGVLANQGKREMRAALFQVYWEKVNTRGIYITSGAGSSAGLEGNASTSGAHLSPFGRKLVHPQRPWVQCQGLDPIKIMCTENCSFPAFSFLLQSEIHTHPLLLGIRDLSGITWKRSWRLPPRGARGADFFHRIQP